MRTIVCIFCFIPFALAAQTKSDAIRAMNKFMKFYNAGLDDSAYYMITAGNRTVITRERNVEDMKWYRDNLGSMISCNYLGIDNDDPEHVFVFKTEWTKKGKLTSSFNLDEANNFATFRLATGSKGIDKLLKNDR